LLGYGLALLVGFDAGSGEPPSLGAALVIGLPAMAVAIAPGLGALIYGVRAGRGRQWAGWVAAAVGALSVVYWVTVTFVGLIFEAAIA
jgi:amino acid permease